MRLSNKITITLMTLKVKVIENKIMRRKSKYKKKLVIRMWIIILLKEKKVDRVVKKLKTRVKLLKK